MHTLTVEITHDNALRMLQDLQEKHFIKILEMPDPKSLVFPGDALTPEEFRSWIEGRENGISMSLKTAKSKWAEKERQLLASGK